MPSIFDVLVDELSPCGQDGMFNWNVTIIAIKKMTGGHIPLILTNDAMVDSKFLPLNPRELKWRAAAGPLQSLRISVHQVLHLATLTRLRRMYKQ